MSAVSKVKKAVRRDKVTVWVDNAGKWRWTRRSGWNGQVTAVSGQGYTRRDHAVRMAKRVNRRSVITVEER